MHSEKFNNKINNLKEHNKRLSYNYFTKFETINNLLNIVIKKKELIRGSFGNYNAKTVFVVNFDKTSDKVIDLIKKYYNSNNLDFYSLYITPINKFEDRELDLKVLKKEIQIINPNRVIVLGDEIEFENGISYSREMLDELLICLENEEIKKNSNTFKKARLEFVNCIKYALYGKY